MFGGEFGQGEGPGENIPAWLVFELAPTKLAHYPLPTYGALAWLAAGGWHNAPDLESPGPRSQESAADTELAKRATAEYPANGSFFRPHTRSVHKTVA